MIRGLLAAALAAGAIAGVGVVAAPIASADLPYANWKSAANDGRYNIPKGDSAYSPKLDRDVDGIACES